MNKPRFFTATAILFAGISLFLANSLYIVDQRELALVSEFGRIVSVKNTPGLKILIPFIQKVKFFDKRLQNIMFHSDDSNEVVTSDQKTMKLDAFAKYKITNAVKFYQAAQNEKVFKLRLASILESTIREVVGTATFADVLGKQRLGIMQRISDAVKEQIEPFGVSVADVRITRVGLPEKAKQAVYERMRSARAKEAAEIRAHGVEESQIIRAQTDKDKVMLLANAKKDAEILKGEGDSESARIFADSVGQDSEFYVFYRSLQAYRNSLNASNTTFVLSTDDKFFAQMNSGGKE